VSPASSEAQDRGHAQIEHTDQHGDLEGLKKTQQHKAGCHSAQGDRIGRVEPIADLGTDPTRIAEFTPQLSDALNRLGTDRWQLRNFRLQNGYVNTPLDGLWLRGPYLHNGSVPTLRDLLKPQDERPKRFCRGGEVYDWNVHFPVKR